MVGVSVRDIRCDANGRAKGTQGPELFLRHLCARHNVQVVTTNCGRHRERDASVPAGGLDDGSRAEVRVARPRQSRQVPADLCSSPRGSAVLPSRTSVSRREGARPPRIEAARATGSAPPRSGASHRTATVRRCRLANGTGHPIPPSRRQADRSHRIQSAAKGRAWSGLRGFVHGRLQETMSALGRPRKWGVKSAIDRTIPLGLPAANARGPSGSRDAYEGVIAGTVDVRNGRNQAALSGRAACVSRPLASCRSLPLRPRASVPRAE